METQTTPSRYWEQDFREEKALDFYTSRSDSGHIIVSRFLPVEGKEVIGHIYIEIEGDEIWYFSTNRKGREIFHPTTDFNLIETKFERYARLLALQQRTKNNYQLNKNNLTIKNQNTMQNQNKTTEQKTKKENQLRFIEYEKPAGDGHFVTIADSYHNVIGRVHKSFNDETKKYEYVAFDHAGNPFAKSDKLWQVKNEFVKNRETLLEQAHQRRIESKEKSQQVQPSKSDDRKKETEKLRHDKSGVGKQTDKSQEKAGEQTDRRTDDANNQSDEAQAQQEEREQELEDLRDDKDDDRGDMDMER